MEKQSGRQGGTEDRKADLKVRLYQGFLRMQVFLSKEQKGIRIACQRHKAASGTTKQPGKPPDMDRKEISRWL